MVTCQILMLLKVFVSLRARGIRSLNTHFIISLNILTDSYPIGSMYEAIPDGGTTGCINDAGQRYLATRLLIAAKIE